MTDHLKVVEAEYTKREADLKLNQTKLWNFKDMAKWENTDISLLTDVDKKELLIDTKNKVMILPGE